MSKVIPIGSIPPVGQVPEKMFAQVIRPERYGDPLTAFQVEEIAVPEIKPHEVLIAVMAAGINYNNVWAARGIPINVVRIRQKMGEPYDFHIGGSDVAGIVYAIGYEVDEIAIGDEVVVHHGYWDPDDPWVLDGKDPMLSPSARIWGYNTNFGSFGQFCVAQAHQVMPKAPHLAWEQAAAPSLVGTTAYRMLFGWQGNVLKEGDVVLVWGGSGGLGSQAIQLANVHGAQAVAVVSDDERGEFCKQLGAVGYINRHDFSHWGIPPHWTDAAGQKEWTSGCRAFGKAIWDVLGERRNPDIVFEHPGEDTIPTSIFVCEAGGMVVICAGTTGYSASVDLRYHWVRQKRLQGSHGSNDEQATAYNQLVVDGKIDPCVGQVYVFEDIGKAHADMEAGETVFGNRVALVGAPEPGLGESEENEMTEQPKPGSGAQIETVIIFTPHMEELARFYQLSFNLGEYNASPGHLGQQIGPVYLGFDQDDVMTTAGPSVTLWFTVDDIQASYERLIELGAQDRYAPTHKPWGAVLAAVYDPDGNMVGLSQRKP